MCLCILEVVGMGGEGMRSRVFVLGDVEGEMGRWGGKYYDRVEEENRKRMERQ